ncbi:MAG: hypothetical protein MJ010_08495 [Paludibacteraceae bacterium]|nr:hypothetical protein [Paludibacteraceae bacterium]
MKEIQSKLITVYYLIYAVFVIGLVLAHLFPLRMGVLQGTEAIVMGYVNVGFLLVFIPLAISLFNAKIKKQVDLEYYLKWNLIQMLLIAVPGLVSIASYALLRDRSSLFAYLIVFVALILTKPTKYKITKYFESKEE